MTRRTALGEALLMAGYTQEGLAEKLGVDRATVQRWHSGKNRPQPYLWPKLAKVLGVSPQQLREILAASGGTVHRGSSDAESSGAGIDRRSVLSTGVSVGVLLALGESRTQAFNPALVDTFVDLRDSLVAADSLLGSGSLVNSAVEQVSNVARLFGRADLKTRGRLFEVGALFAEFCGWLADDLGKFEDGRSWSRQALEWAHASGSADLLAYVLMRMSQQAQLVGDEGAAAALAHSSGRYDSSVRSVRVRAAVRQQAAHASALDGDEVSALSHLDAAYHLSGKDLDEEDPYSLAGYCTPVYVTVQRAAVLNTLGKHRDALDEYDRVLGDWPQEFHRERGLHLARRTHVAVRAGVPDAAVESGFAALTIARETQSRRTIRELVRSAAGMQQWRSYAGVDDFVEAVATEGEAEWAC
ncbi:helix-turn-helix transcriptional regulator [Lentzea sp. NPDC004782]|uniref:helix-turn-helix transcriptional regulator n=1 Tax=Lentzea sp. NPDC004782 TaxID=3154458 RepID=UPI0033B369C1